MPARSSAALEAAGLRVELDLRNEKINYKVREHSLAKIPYLLVVGKREAEERTVALRPLGADARQEVIGARRAGRAAARRGAAARSSAADSTQRARKAAPRRRRHLSFSRYY